jgi:hypothetical protein
MEATGAGAWFILPKDCAIDGRCGLRGRFGGGKKRKEVLAEEGGGADGDAGLPISERSRRTELSA